MDKKHLLVVDDDQNLLRSLAFIFRIANYRVTTAANGQEALERIFTTETNLPPIDLLITDIRMPGVTGLQLINELKRRDVKIPVVAITAYGTPQLATELRRKGCVDCLDKALDEEALVKRIDMVLRRYGPNDLQDSKGTADNAHTSSPVLNLPVRYTCLVDGKE